MKSELLDLIYELTGDGYTVSFRSSTHPLDTVVNITLSRDKRSVMRGVNHELATQGCMDDFCYAYALREAAMAMKQTEATP